VPDHGHSAKRVYIALVTSSFSLTLSLPHTPCRRRRTRAATPPRPRRARVHAARAHARAHAALARPAHALAARPQPRPRRTPCSRFVRDRAVDSSATAPSIRPRPVVPPVGMIRFYIELISFVVLNLCTCMIRLILSIDDCRPSCR
jgi:hypothetical protein